MVSDQESGLMQSEDKILGANEVAELLGMDVQMIRKYAREGRLPAYRLPGGRTFKFFRSEVLDFVRAHPASTEGS